MQVILRPTSTSAPLVKPEFDTLTYVLMLEDRLYHHKQEGTLARMHGEFVGGMSCVLPID